MMQGKTSYFYLFCGVIFFSFLFVQSGVAPAPDTTWLMLCAERWLGGGRYYYDFMEVNPPASILLHVPIIFLSEILPIPAYEISFYYFASLFLFSACLCMSLFYQLTKFEKHPVYPVLCLTLLILALALPGIHFGQRDFILFVAVLPFVFAFVLKTYGFQWPRTLEWVCYIWAALFFILKPHFYIVVIGLFLFRCRVQKTFWRTFREFSFYIIGGVACFYLLGVYLFFPEFLSLMLHDVLNIYIDGSIHFKANLILRAVEFVVVTSIIFFGMRFVTDTKIRNISAFLLFLSALFVAAFFAQGKGFIYHYLPAQILLYSSVSIFIFGVLKNTLKGREPAIVMMGLMLCFAFVQAKDILSWEHNIQNYTQSEKIAYLNANVRQGETFSILQSSLGSSAPAYFYTDGNWASRFPSLWFLHDFLREKENRRRFKTDIDLQSSHSRYQKMIVEDLMKYKPKLVLILNDGYFFQFMEGNKEFMRIWKQYSYKEEKIFPVAKELYNESFSTTYDVYSRN